MSDTTTAPTTTQTDPAPQGGTPTGQGTFIPPTPAAPKPAPPAQGGQPQPSAPTPTDAPDAADSKGKGSKEAVLADLATERDKRQAAETTAQETAAKLDAVLTALGLKTDTTQVDPDRLTADLQAQRAENAVLRHGQGIADTDALLDSRKFTDTLTKVNVDDPAAVKAHIEAFVTENPRYATQAGTTPPATTPGVRDAAANPQQTSAETDWLRAAIRR